mmetsp:Transcript_131483/g.420689  ORF Transcript_131483/g.420689 Transcript_131483/m.420689 type:complete len:307 (-) Transcript_131483:9-929(-)
MQGKHREEGVVTSLLPRFVGEPTPRFGLHQRGQRLDQQAVALRIAGEDEVAADDDVGGGVGRPSGQRNAPRQVLDPGRGRPCVQPILSDVSPQQRQRQGALCQRDLRAQLRQTHADEAGAGSQLHRPRAGQVALLLQDAREQKCAVPDGRAVAGGPDACDVLEHTQRSGDRRHLTHRQSGLPPTGGFFARRRVHLIAAFRRCRRLRCGRTIRFTAGRLVGFVVDRRLGATSRLANLIAPGLTDSGRAATALRAQTSEQLLATERWHARTPNPEATPRRACPRGGATQSGGRPMPRSNRSNMHDTLY